MVPLISAGCAGMEPGDCEERFNDRGVAGKILHIQTMRVENRPAE
jgi:hypothetical protein